MESEVIFLLQVREGARSSWSGIRSSTDEEWIKEEKGLYEWKNADRIKYCGWKFRIVRATTTYEVMEEAE